MRTILHVSDLHFGRNNVGVMRELIAVAREVRPDVLVISGDLTQRALRREFEEARAFIREMREHCGAYVVIPGNHDIYPYYAPVSRMRRPYERYLEYLGDAPTSYQDDEVMISAINTVSRITLSRGLVNKKHVVEVSKWFSESEGDVVKIAVTHHPLDRSHAHPVKFFKLVKRIAYRSKRALKPLSQSGVDIFLSGHWHFNGAGFIRASRDLTKSTLSFFAGTVSDRDSVLPRSFNLIRIEAPTVSCTPYLWRDDHFEPEAPAVFERSESGFREASQPVAVVS